MLASYSSMFMAKVSSKTVNEAEFDEMLKNTATVFDHIEDKDVFQQFCARMLAKRLLKADEGSKDLETRVVSSLRVSCDAKFTTTLQRMLQDFQTSKDLGSSYSAWRQEQDIPESSNVDGSYQILYSNFWNLRPPTTDFTPPQLIVNGCNQFTKFYNQKYQGRRLTWLWGMSTSEVQVNYMKWNGKTPYTFQLSLFQMAILLQFNDADEISYEEIKSKTSLETAIFSPCISSLVKAKVLLMQPAGERPGPSSIYSLNYNFKNKIPKVSLHITMKTERASEADSAYRSQEEERRLVMQCAILRIMKSRRQMPYQTLVTETIQQLTSRFKATSADVKKHIDILIEREFLERLDDDTLGYLV